ncbi:ATP-binding protein [Lactonifactor longoviformis]|uniref:ATP-binding protein n=1 Tax=Lactonifactor longoviformis TaxID=341220 RepID=UPI0036F3A7E6
MNIKEAKTEIKNTIRAYTRKNERGEYLFPRSRQRPVLLIGPPGIGKTAIMEQIAEECNVGLVAYTITHHTRQSAIGLPRIEERIYQGTSFQVTEYTMSEIIASVYECIERTGHQEGILFIDEINCVSETLAPTMLQFLQNKTFGSHKVPQGWVIVAAGNPPAYNKSVREFDVVTLDRVKKILVEADCSVWMEYASGNRIHGGILSYLNIRKDNFYLVENTPEGKFFVTARGWEDLSEMIKSYEELHIPVTEDLMVQYLQKEDIARDFASYYHLYEKYQGDYQITEMLEGTLGAEAYSRKVDMGQAAAFDERLTIAGLLLDQLSEYFGRYTEAEALVKRLHQRLLSARDWLSDNSSSAALEDFLEQQRHSLEVKVQAELISVKEEELEEKVLRIMEGYLLILKEERLTRADLAVEKLRALFALETERRKQVILRTQKALKKAFDFMQDTFGDDQEMILFVTGLSKNREGMDFIRRHGCPEYFACSKKLLFREREEELKQEIESLQRQWQV